MKVASRTTVAPVVAGKGAGRIRVLAAVLRMPRFARRIVAVLIGASGLLVGSTGGASATSTDPTGGAGDTFFTSLESYFTGHVLVSVLALLALTVGVSMLISWGRKAAKSK